MPLEAKVVPVTLKGLNTKNTRTGGAMGSLDVCENVIWTKGDADGVMGEKRSGLITTLPNTAGGTIGQPLQCFSVGETLFQTSAAALWGLAGDTWHALGRQPPGVFTPEVLGVGPSYVECTDGAVGTGGLELSAYQALTAFAGGVYVTLRQNAQTIYQNKLVAGGGIRPKVVWAVDRFLVFYMANDNPGFNANLRVAALDSTGILYDVLVATMSATSSNAGLTNGWFDVQFVSATSVVVFYNDSAGTLIFTSVAPSTGVAAAPVVTILGATQSGGLIAAYRTTATLGFVHEVIVGNPAGARVVWVNPVGGAVLANQALLLTAGPGNVTGVFDDISGISWVIAEVTNARTTSYRVVTGQMSNAGVLLSGFTKRSLGLASKATLFQGVPVVLCAYTEALVQPASSCQAAALATTGFFLFELDTATIISKTLVDTAGGIEWLTISDQDLSPHSSTLPGWSITGTGRGQEAVLFTKRIAAEVAAGPIVLQRRQPVRVAFAMRELAPPLAFGDERFILGGLPFTFDGSDLAGQFLVRPPAPQITILAGGALEIGKRSFVVVYAWTDQLGQVHRSAPSAPASGTTSAGFQSIHVTYDNYRLVAGNLNVTSFPQAWVEVYGTQVGADFYRMISPVDSVLANDPANDTTVWSDPVADTVWPGGQPLYTMADELDHWSPSPMRAGVVWQDRAVGVSQDAPGTLIFSMAKQAGLGLTFAAELTYALPGTPNIVALAIMDDKLCCFTDDARVFFVAGQLPNDLGQGLALSATAVPVQSSVLGPAQVATIAGGIMAKTDAGIYMLDRGGNWAYLGSPVENFNDLATTAIVPGRGETRTYVFHSDGQCLVYDHFWGLWSTFTGHEALGACMLSSGDYAFLRPEGVGIGGNDGRMRQRYPFYNDDGIFIVSRYSFSDFSFAGVEGYEVTWQSIVTGEYVSPHTLHVDVVYNFKSPAAITDAFASDIVSAADYAMYGPYGTEPIYADGDGTYQFPCMFSDIYNTAIKLVVYDSVHLEGGAGGGFRFSDLTFEVGVLPRSNRIAPQKRLQLT